MKLETLPQELLQSILNNIDSKPDLYQCRLVKRLWKAITNHILYKEIKFTKDGGDISKTIERIKGFKKSIETCDKTEDLSSLVKYVDIDIRLKNLSEEQIRILLSFVQWLGANCKNIKTFKIYDLTITHLDSELATKLWDTVKKGKWKLEEIGETGHMAINNQGYLSTLLMFAETIKTAQFDVYKTPEEKKFIFDPAKFLNLRTLVVNAVGFKRIYELDGYISPRLTSVTLRMIDSTSGSNEVSQLAQNITDGDMSGIKQCTTIKQMTFSGHLNEKAICYTIHKFPRLEDLFININPSYVQSQQGVKGLSSNMITNLSNYLVNIKKITITGILWPNYAELFKAMMEKSKEGNVKAKWNVNLYTRDIQSVYFKKKRCADGVESYILIIHSQDTSSLLYNFGTSLTKVRVEMPETGLAFNSILEHCPNLKCLKIHKGEFSLSTVADMVTNTLIEKLTLRDYEISPGVLSELSVRFPNLKFLKFLGYGHDPESRVLDFSSIVTGFPSLEYLEVENYLVPLDNLPSTEKNISLQKLTFSDCKIDVDIFPVLSKYFPNVKHLVLIGDDQDPESYMADLSSMITSLSSLEILVLQNYHISLANFVRTGENTALRNLEFIDCNISVDIFPVLSKHFPNLNYIHCEGINLDQESVPLRYEEGIPIVGPINTEMPHTYLKAFAIIFNYYFPDHTVYLPKTCSLKYSPDGNPMTRALPGVLIEEAPANENISIQVNINCKKIPIDTIFRLYRNKCIITYQLNLENILTVDCILSRNTKPFSGFSRQVIV